MGLVEPLERGLRGQWQAQERRQQQGPDALRCEFSSASRQIPYAFGSVASVNNHTE